MNKQNRLHFLYNTKRKVKRLHKISNAASSGSFHVDETDVTIRRWTYRFWHLVRGQPQNLSLILRPQYENVNLDARKVARCNGSLTNALITESFKIVVKRVNIEARVTSVQYAKPVSKHWNVRYKQSIWK